MKLLNRILASGLFVAMIVLLAYPTNSTAVNKNQKAQDEKSKKQVKESESTSSRVKLNVTVFDSSNRPVTDVSPEDFQVFEDGVQQRITSVSRNNEPLSLGLLIDSSGSLRTQISTIMRAGGYIISNMKPDDEAFIIRFISHDKITLIQDWTSSRALLHRKMDDIFTEGGLSSIVDAVYTATQHVAERKKRETSPRRYSLVLITDGEDRSSYYNLEQLLKLLGESELQIFVIGLPEQIEGMKPQEKALDLLNTLANETGGRAFFIDGKLEPSESGIPSDSVASRFSEVRRAELDQIISEITIERDAQYQIAYDSTHGALDGSYRKVRVSIKEKDGRDKRKALTRPGYTVPRK